MESQTEIPEASYKIVSYLAKELPQEFHRVIVGPFLSTLRYGNEMFKLIEQDSYYKTYPVYIEHLLIRPQSQIRIAMLSDKTVLGWSLSENETLHYVWVKKEVRRQGIGKALLPKKFSKISHVTNIGLSIWPKYPEVKFDPFI